MIHYKRYLLPLIPLVFGACAEYEGEPPVETVPLTFYLQTAGNQGATRAYEGDVTDKSAENAINTISVWLFDHGKAGETTSTAGLLLDYQDAFTDSETKKVTMNVPKYIVEQAHTVDVYAIANVEQAGLTQDQLKVVTTIDGLKELTMQGTNFTPTGLTKLGGTDGVTYLPMSRILQDWPVVDQTGGTNKISTKLGEVMITRAVSKIRFAFARPTGIDGVKVTGIELGTGLFPNTQYVLPIDSTTSPDNYAKVEGKGRYIGDKLPNIGNDYIASPLQLRATGDTDWSTQLFDPTLIKEYDKPEDNTWEVQKSLSEGYTPQMYDEFVSTIIGTDTYDLTTYLRETDKVLTGTIHYMIGDEKRSATFSMTTDQVNDFARNHEWIVYGYFKGEELILTVTVLPWDKWLRKADYKDNVSVSQQLTWNSETYNTSASATATAITIDGVPHQVLVLDYGTAIEGSFSFDTPYGGTWMAILEPINGSENGSIVFSGAETGTTLQGIIGTNAVTFQIKAANNQVSQNQYARLRFVCYSQDHQPYKVSDGVIGGPYVIAQYAN